MRALSALALAVCLTAPAAAHAEVLERTGLRDFGAFAEWQYTDAAGTQTFPDVIVSKFSTKPNFSDDTPKPALANSIFSVDAAGFVVFSGTGVTETFQYDFDPNLGTAHVVGTVLTADEGQGTSEDFNVDVSWTATGGVMNATAVSHFREGTFMSLLHVVGTQRPASAVGTVFGKGVERTSGLLSTSALLLKNTSGSLTFITGSSGSH